MTPGKFGNEKFVANFIDDYSRMTWAYPMKAKSDLFQKFKMFIAESHIPGKRLHTLRSDRGSEYTANEMNKFCLDNQIKQEFTLVDTPQQNGDAEVSWRILFAMSRASMDAAGLDPSYWAQALETAVYVRNRCLTTALQTEKTPYEMMYGKKPNIQHMRIFGCRVYVYRTRYLTKLDNRAVEGLFLGYARNSKGYVVYVPSIRKLVHSRNVRFLESIHEEEEFADLPDIVETEEVDNEVAQTEVQNVTVQQPPILQQNVAVEKLDVQAPAKSRVTELPRPTELPKPIQTKAQKPAISNIKKVVTTPPSVREEARKIVQATKSVKPAKSVPDTKKKLIFDLENVQDLEPDWVDDYANLEEDTDESFEDEEAERPTTVRRSNRESRKPGQWWITSNYAAENVDNALEFAMHVQAVDGNVLLNTGPYVPTTFKEAAKKPEWHDAAIQEYKGLVENGTWELVTRDLAKNLIDPKWTFKLKENADGTINKYKARLVAKGYTQVEGVDYNETFAPVAKFDTIRTMLAMAALLGMNVCQMDVNTAYLHADVEEDLYMRQPEGFELEGPNGEELVCKLKKSLYGLKQSGRNWNRTLNAHLKEIGFEQSSTDPCLYVLHGDDGYIAITIYVDDIISIDNNTKLREEIVEKMRARFKITDLGTAKWILGMEIIQHNNRIAISQEKYIRDMLKKFKMEECNTTPLPAYNLQLPDTSIAADREQFQSITGSLIYASVISRPDIAFAVGKISQKMTNPTVQDYTAAKKILRYLKGTMKHGPSYGRTGDRELTGYSDADWAGDTESRRSTTGFVFTLAGAAISWNSKRQPTVALSSTEAEYMAGCAAAQEAIYLKSLLKDLGYSDKPINIYQDNQGAIAMGRNNMTTKRSKHIDIKYHFIREKVEEGTINLSYLPTTEMVADILTKHATKVALEKARPKLFGSQVRFA
jgi:hypothetical protein